MIHFEFTVQILIRNMRYLILVFAAALLHHSEARARWKPFPLLPGWSVKTDEIEVRGTEYTLFIKRYITLRL